MQHWMDRGKKPRLLLSAPIKNFAAPRQRFPIFFFHCRSGVVVFQKKNRFIL